MSGHSKWAQIKRQKGVADIKRGAQFTKLANAITIAVRQGGGIGDPESNFKLRLAVDRARAFNMPKENIERAIKRAQGTGEGQVLEEVVYEGFAPGGVAVIVEAVTDNKQRTVSFVKNVFEKGGGTFAAPGSVSYLFKKVGEIVIKKNGKNIDEVLQSVLLDGVEDIEDFGDEAIVYTDISSFQVVKKKLEEQGFVLTSADLTLKSTNLIKLDLKMQEKVISFLDSFEELDDVQKVYSSLDYDLTKTA